MHTQMHAYLRTRMPTYVHNYMQLYVHIGRNLRENILGEKFLGGNVRRIMSGAMSGDRPICPRTVIKAYKMQLNSYVARKCTKQ